MKINKLLLPLLLTLALGACGGNEKNSQTSNQSGTETTESQSIEDYIPVSSISLNPKELTLEIGDFYNIKPTIEPDKATNKTLTWTSSNFEIAKVSYGKVTAVSAGTATITATSIEGISDVCTVTVLSAEHVHVWDFENITWNWDGYECETATVSCLDSDCGLTTDFATTVTSTTVPATSTTDGSVTYVASFQEGGVTYSDTKVSVIPAQEQVRSIMNPVVSGYMDLEDGDDLVKFLDQHTYAYGDCKESNDFQENIVSWASDGSSQYTITISKNSDYSSPVKVDTVTTTSYNYGLYVPGVTYYVQVKGTKSNAPIFTDTFKIKDNEVRYVNVEGAKNFRDLGGYTTTDGKTVNYELLYRGANLNGNPYHNSGSGLLTEKGKQTMREMGVKTEVDFRGPCTNGEDYLAGRAVKPNGDDGGQWATGNAWDSVNGEFLQANTQGQCFDGIVYWPSDYNHFKTLVPRIFEVMANPNSYPVYFHCNAGADRTGTFGFIFNALLGVPYEQLVKDFELTSFSSGGGFRRRNKLLIDGKFEDIHNLTHDEIRAKGEADQNNALYYCSSFDALYAIMMQRYSNGGTLQEAVYNWCIDMGVKPTQIESFRNIMLEDNDYSEYEGQTYTVTLKNLGGEDRTISVEGGKCCSELFTKPVRQGYTFVNWYGLDGNVYNPYQRITSNTTIVAGWAKYTTNTADLKENVVFWTKDLVNQLRDTGTGGFTDLDFANTIVEGVGLCTRTDGQLFYSMAFPIVNYSVYEAVEFEVVSKWTDSRILFSNSSIESEFLPISSTDDMTKRTITIKDGKLYVGASEFMTLSDDVNNGIAPLWIASLRPENQATNKTSGLYISNLTTYYTDTFVKVMDAYGYVNNIEDYSTCDLTLANKKLGVLDELYETSLSNEEKELFPITDKITGLKNYLDSLPMITATYVIGDTVLATEEVKFGSSLQGLGKDYAGYIISGYEVNGEPYNLSTLVTEDLTITVIGNKYQSLGYIFNDASVASEVTSIGIPAGYSHVYSLSNTKFNVDYIFKNIDISGYSEVRYLIMGDANNNSNAYIMNETNPAKSSGYGASNASGIWHEVKFVKKDSGKWTMTFNGTNGVEVDSFDSAFIRLNPGTFYFTDLVVIK